ncbi:MAG: VWA domain-containing protein [Deltaproteobacteria bacterium]|nr:VWA domain-containing protein [Deltaproteobacteria bacterium]
MPSFSIDKSTSTNILSKTNWLRKGLLTSSIALAFLFLHGCSDPKLPDSDDGGGALAVKKNENPPQIPNDKSNMKKVKLAELELHNQVLESTEKDGWTLRSVARAPADESSFAEGKVSSKGLLGLMGTGSGGGGDFGGRGPGSGESLGRFLSADPPAPSLRRPTGAAVGSRGGLRVESDSESFKEVRKAMKKRSRKPSPARERTPRQAPKTSLKAASTDDNKDFEAFKKFLITWSDKSSTAGQVQRLDVRERAYLRVENKDGKSIPMANVVVKDVKNKAVIWAGKTHGNGELAFYPRIALPKTKGKVDGGFVLEAEFDGKIQQVSWDGSSKAPTLILDVDRPVEEPLALDVLFILDTTGSMSDELQRIKDSLLSVTKKLRTTGKEFDLRYGAVLYRDITDGYVTKRHPFVSDVDLFSSHLQSVQAGGGGDRPESLNQGLAVGVEQMKWRKNSVKIAFVVADAPPHMDYEQDVPYGESALRALEKGIKIHMVAASGLQEFGSLVFRQTAQLTGGKFIFIEYGGNIAASAAKHGVKNAPQKSNNLDDILFEQVQEELAHWGQ